MIVAVVGDGPGSARLAAQLEHLPDRTRARRRDIPAGDPATMLDALATLAGLAAENGESFAVVPGDLIVSDTPLRDVLDDPRPANRLLVHGGADDVRVTGTTVLAVGSERHETGAATAGDTGLLHVRADSVAAAAAAWRAAAADVRDLGWDDVDGVRAAVVAFARTGEPLAAVPSGPYVAARDAALLGRAEELDEDDLVWRRASRGGDGMWSTFALRPVSRRISRRAVRAGLTPNQVTVIGFVLGLLAAALVALGGATTVIAGALLLQVALVLDCVDGEIARSTRGFSAFGAWLDLVTDRVKENAVLAAIAIGEPRLWPLAVAGIGLQLTRHMADYAFADTVLAWWRRPAADTRPFADTAPAPSAASGDRLGAPTGRGLVHWVKQAIHMQIGERWLVLSVTLIVGTFTGGGRVALVAYLVTVGAGLAWVLVGWTLRTITSPRRKEPLPEDVARVVTSLRDDGLAEFRPSRSPLTWYLPLAVTAWEGLVLLRAHDRTTLAWAFLWAFAVAWHRYDIFYRSRGGRTPVPTLVNRLGVGGYLRGILLFAAGIFGQLHWFIPVGAIWLLLVYVPESLFHAKPRKFARSVGVLKKEVRRAIAVPVARLFMRVTRPKRLALVAGLPDSEENSLATAAELARSYPGEVVLVANDPAPARAALDRVAALLGIDASRVTVIAKKGAFGTFLRAELVFYTHGLYDSPRPVGRRLHVNLWHGTGPKWNANANFAQRIGAQAHAASSPLWGHEAMRALSVPADARLVAGNPRQDVVAAARDRHKLDTLGLDPARPLVVWLPTFRSSATAGLVGLREGDPITAADGRAFAAAAERHGVQLAAKPHRLDSELFTSLGVTVLTDEQILAAGLTLHELMGFAAGLVSDYSSGWVDVLDRDVSIALHVPDIDAYRTARGLNRPDLAVVADGLTITPQDADAFFADVAAGRVWQAAAKDRCAERIELIDVPAGARTRTMLAQLGELARERLGDDLGLGDRAQRRPVTES